MLGQQRGHRARSAIHAVSAAQHEVGEFVDPQRRRQQYRGHDGFEAAQRVIPHAHRRVGARRQRILQQAIRLDRPDAQRGHGSIGRPQPQRQFQRAFIGGIHHVQHATGIDQPGQRIDLDGAGIGDVFEANRDTHESILHDSRKVTP